MIVEPQCSQHIFDETYGGHQCFRRGTVVEEDQSWCRQHSPSACRRRRAKTDARIDAILRENDRRVAVLTEVQHRADAFPALLEALEEAVVCIDNLADRQRARTAIAKAKERST